ncbi:metallophosphoesterase [Salibacterium aidingense]|uniref:metallophosphoesterase n=1 Tax=Salibacterium aidingense TaxID=384933 RepID=UPI003BCD033E
MRYINYLMIGCFFWLGWMFAEAKRNKVSNEFLDVKNLPNSFSGRSIFFISDIHFRRISKKVIQTASCADLVIIGGDLMEKGVPFPRVKKNIQKLKSIGPVVFVWGNNDMEENPEKLAQLLREEGVTVLENSVYMWNRQKENIWIAGAGNRRQTVDKSLLHSCRSDDTILLALHDPAFIKEMDHKEKLSAAFAGHTHGGQIRIGRFSLREKGGWRFSGEFPLLISNGYGTTKLPFRFGAPAQTHLITLKKK